MSILLLFFITIIISNVKASDVPLYMCNFEMFSFDTCTYKNIHTNKTHFDINPVRTQEKTKVVVKNSTLQKLGKFGFCSSPYSFLDTYGSSTYELDLTDCSIEEIHTKAFEECSKLKTLILRNNKIEELDKSLFNGNNKLEKIDLSNNLLKKMDNDIFVNQRELKELLLSGNKFKMFRVDFLKPCSNLEVLRLDSNDIFDLDSKKIMKYLTKLKKIAFNNNQLRCERVQELIDDFKSNVVDNEYEGNAKERIKPTKTQNSIICLEDIPWAAAHYIHMYTKISEIK